MRTSYFLKGIGTAIFLLGTLLSAWANEAINYELTKDKIKNAWVSKKVDGYFEVVVELTDMEKKSFSMLTEKNIHKELQITFLGQVMSNTVIRAKIESGIMGIGRWKSEKEAEEFLKTLLPQTP